MTNAQVLRRQKNNFDALRLLFAVIVVLFHVHVLTGFPRLAWLSRLISSQVAVHGFFVISGFLITMSFEKNRNVGSYFLKRARRIYPAYVAVILLTVVVGVWMTELSWSAYLGSFTCLSYLASNLTFLNFLQPSLPGVFESNYLEDILNGSLWSIKIEVLCYCLVPILGWMSSRAGPLVIYGVVYLMSFILGGAIKLLHQRTGYDWLPIMNLELSGPIACFASGAIIYYGFETFQRWSRIGVVMAFGVLVMVRWLRINWGIHLLEPMSLGVVILFVAYNLPYLGNFGRFGDLSYGIYIYHFPIIQCMIYRGDFAHEPFQFLVGALALTLLAAFLSWHLIEKRWLRRDSYYVLAQSSDGIEQAVS